MPIRCPGLRADCTTRKARTRTPISPRRSTSSPRISGVAPEVIARSVRMVDPEYVEPRNIQPVIDVLAKYGQLDRAFPAEEIISSAALKPR